LKYARETVELAHEINSGYKEEDAPIRGIDLAGDESRYRASSFVDVFKLVKEYGFPVTAHAAEAAGADSARDALELLHARRIGHGIRIKEDPDLLEYILEKKIPLEVCLTSNLQTSTVPSLDAHPFREYLDRGIAVTINTDDPAVSGITLSHEWEIAEKQYSLTRDEMKRILMNSAAAAFTSDEIKRKLTRQIDDYFK